MLTYLIVIFLLIFLFLRRKNLFSNEQFLSQLFFALALFLFGFYLVKLKAVFNLPGPLHTILLTISLLGIALAYYFRAALVLFFSLIGLWSWWFVYGSDMVMKTQIIQLINKIIIIDS